MAETLPPAFDSWLAARFPGIPAGGARAAIELASRGATAAFVAHYRRDATAGLDAHAVRRALEAGEQFARISSRQAIILESIERHATLSPQLRERILACFDPEVLEDLYHPYRQQKKNRALAAREAGLGPLADWIWDCGHGSETPQPGQTLELWAFTFRNEEKGIADAKSAVEGARDILVERLAGTPELRARVRKAYFEEGWLRGARSAKAKPNSRFESFFAFHEKVALLREPQHTHRYLGLRRGQAEDELQISLAGGPDDPEFEARLVSLFEQAACSVPESPGADVLRHAARIALKNDVRTAIENEVHHALGEAASAAIVAGFAEAARRRLLAPALGPRPVVGVDPGPRGCRLAAVGATGGLEASGAFELPADAPAADVGGAIVALVRQHAAEAVAIGDGAGGREAQLSVRAGLRAAGLELPVELVSEAGASGWAAGDAARAELPDCEPAVRAAVSIARRLQDPLAELVKLEPKALGAGPHLHEVPHALVQRALTGAIQDAIAAVGVDINAAPRALLARVPGLTPAAAAAVVERRTARGRFATRRELVELAEVDEAAFEQAAGFLRVREGAHPLDATGVHPEHYPALEALSARHQRSVGQLLGEGAGLVRDASPSDLALGPLARQDVVSALEQAGRDPRPPFVPFAFRDDVSAIGDLKPGMLCPGVVTNVTSFGVFVDIGARQDGLVHVSQLDPARARARGPLQPGDRVEVRVLKLDLEKKQISLSMKPRAERRAPAARAPRGRPAPSPAAAPPRAAQGPRPQPPRERPAGRERPRPQPAPRAVPARPAAAARLEPRRQAFNNPFAVLAGLKKDDKK